MLRCASSRNRFLFLPSSILAYLPCAPELILQLSVDANVQHLSGRLFDYRG